MKYYAVIGDNQQVINGSDDHKCPDGFIEMQEPRPTPEHIADVSGQWVLPEVSKDEENAQ